MRLNKFQLLILLGYEKSTSKVHGRVPLLVGNPVGRNSDGHLWLYLLVLAGSRICRSLSDIRMAAYPCRSHTAVQSSGPHAGRGWGWWLAGGIIDMFIGFMMVRSIVLSEAVFPYFLAFIFIFWGISALCASVQQSGRRYWWLQLVNGILLLLIGFFFIEAGWIQDMAMTSFLTSLAFIYWGFSLSMLSYDMKPSR